MLYYKIKQTKQGIALFEDNFDRRFLAKTETVFSQCNGYLGVRAAYETKTVKETRGAFLGGFYHSASQYEVTELVNCPDVTEMELHLDDETISLDLCRIREFERTFYLETGELETAALLETEGGKRIWLKSRRFVSRDNKHLLVHEVMLEPLAAAVLTVVTGINGQMTNSGVSHFARTEARVFEQQYLYTKNECDDGQQLHVLCATTADRKPERTDFTLKRRSVYEVKRYHLKDKESLCLTKCSYFCYGKSDDGFEVQGAQKILKESLAAGYEALSNCHRVAFEKLWKYASITIQGASLEEEACLAFAIYHLLGMTPTDTNAYSVAAKGLTGEGYKGHVFWDTELFVLPFFTAVFPDIAKNLLGYRYLGLAGAKKKAAAYGYQGAMYPWEAAATGEEETPLYAALNIHTGKANKVWSGIKEHHVTADIIYALWDYYKVTNDEALLLEMGHEMLIETAIFWYTRSEYKEAGGKGRYELLNIIGPDEYTEHIDNNAYTNYMAWYNVKLAKQEIERLARQHPSRYRELDLRYGLKVWQEKWVDYLNKLYLPKENENGIIPQDDTFLGKMRLWDITKYQQANEKQAILLDYSRDEVVDMQVLKQADTVMLLNLMPNLFFPEVVLNNVLFYEERTIHDSSLSYCAHAIASAKTGYPEIAFGFFEKAMEIDLDDNPKDSTDGIHSGSLGGVWNCIIQGFAGVEHQDHQLSIKPNLPKRWDSIEFYHQAGGMYYKIQVKKNHVQAWLEDGTKVEVIAAEDGRSFALCYR